MRRFVLAGVVGLATLAQAPVQLEATLDGAQEVPAVTSSGSGTGTFTVEDKKVEYAVTFAGLTGVVVGHIHHGAVGTAGAVVITFDGPTGSPFAGTSPPITEEQLQKLFLGEMYANVHTVAQPNGEIRGQIRLTTGKCDCETATSARDFRTCIRNQVRGLEGSERRQPEIKALKRLSRLSACGKTTGPRRAIACCLPMQPTENIVTDRMCAALPEAKCAKKSGTSLGTGTTCFPLAQNPCALSN